MSEEKALATQDKKTSLLAKFGQRYSLDPRKAYDTLLKTAFADAKNEEQVIALLVVADQYGLNPFTKEIYAFPDKKGGVVPVVGVDGWNRIAQQHPQFDGIEFEYGEDAIVPEGGKRCPEWVEVVIYRKDREHPVIIREYLDECYRPPFKGKDGKVVNGPWQSHTKRMLRHKALIQGYRTAFGFHGIYDPDEAQEFIDVEGFAPPPEPGHHSRQGVEALAEGLAHKASPGGHEAKADQEAEEGESGDSSGQRIDPDEQDGNQQDLGL